MHHKTAAVKEKMAEREKALQLDHETFNCSICLDLLKVPVTIPCGHSYCMSCVNTHWDGEVYKESFTCPQCRHNFTWRPVLLKNTMLAALMEELSRCSLPAPVSDCSAATGDASCDLCSGSKAKAVKSCLQCLVSYCKEHLQPHYDVAALKKHKLTEPTANLQDNVCSRHDEVMKMFCRTDQQCICFLCSVDEHKDHDAVLAVTRRQEMQEDLEERIQRTRKMIQVKQRHVDLLQRQADDVIRCGSTAVGETDVVFTQISHLVERIRTEAKKRIRAQQEAEERRIKALQDKVQEEISELKVKYNTLERLSHTEDHCGFILTFPSASKLSEDSDSSDSETGPFLLDLIPTAIAELRDKLLDTSAMTKAADEEDAEVDAGNSADVAQASADAEDRLNLAQVNFPGQTVHQFPQELGSLAPERMPHPENEATSRLELLSFARDVTLDPNTVHRQLSLSADSNTVRYMSSEQEHPEHPDRFTDFAQVLTREPLSGRCYLEVKGRCDDYFSVVVACRDIRRDGPFDQCSFGNNAHSWALDCYDDGYVFWYDKVSTTFTATPSNKIGVYVDYDAGTLSFYSVSQEVALIHTVRTTFTRPLLAGIWLKEVADCAEICNFPRH